MKKGLIAENVETEYFHSKSYVWLQRLDSVWSKAFCMQQPLLEGRYPKTRCELSVTSEPPVFASNPLSAVQGMQVGCPGGAMNNAAPWPC